MTNMSDNISINGYSRVCRVIKFSNIVEGERNGGRKKEEALLGVLEVAIIKAVTIAMSIVINSI